MKLALRNVRFWLPVVLAAGVGLIAAGVAAADDSPADDLVVAGSRPDAVLLHTGDVIGFLEPCG